MIASLYQPFQRWSDGCSVWLISDTHFDDPDCKLMNSDWPHPMRLVNRISKKVGKNDTLIHLGDVGNPQYMRHIHCKHKVLITGNHDAGASKYKEWFHEIYTGPLIIADKLILSHEPVDVPWAFNIHGHCHRQSIPWMFDIYEDPVAYNVCCDVVDYTPVNLGQLIKDGIMSGIKNIHRMTIDKAAERDVIWLSRDDKIIEEIR